MRTFIAALLAATASLPSLVHAYAPSVVPDPVDAAASVPALSAPSFFADYVGYREQNAPGWLALNRAVAKPSGNAGMHHDANHPMGAGAHGSPHEEPVK